MSIWFFRRKMPSRRIRRDHPPAAEAVGPPSGIRVRRAGGRRTSPDNGVDSGLGESQKCHELVVVLETLHGELRP